jgi:hypothetical protein
MTRRCDTSSIGLCRIDEHKPGSPVTNINRLNRAVTRLERDVPQRMALRLLSRTPKKTHPSTISRSLIMATPRREYTVAEKQTMVNMHDFFAKEKRNWLSRYHYGFCQNLRNDKGKHLVFINSAEYNRDNIPHKILTAAPMNQMARRGQ